MSSLPQSVQSVLFNPCFCLKPEIPQDPEEAARLQQLQAAAAQWQQVQQQRAGLQYQALMQHHEKLQKILEQYQQLLQQPADIQVGKLLFLLHQPILVIFCALEMKTRRGVKKSIVCLFRAT